MSYGSWAKDTKTYSGSPMYSGRHSAPDLSGSKAVNSAANAGWSSMKPVPRHRKLQLSEADCWCKQVEVSSGAMGAGWGSGAWSVRKVVHVPTSFSANDTEKHAAAFGNWPPRASQCCLSCATALFLGSSMARPVPTNLQTTAPAAPRACRARLTCPGRTVQTTSANGKQRRRALEKVAAQRVGAAASFSHRASDVTDDQLGQHSTTQQVAHLHGCQEIVQLLELNEVHGAVPFGIVHPAQRMHGCVSATASIYDADELHRRVATTEKGQCARLQPYGCRNL